MRLSSFRLQALGLARPPAPGAPPRRAPPPPRAASASGDAAPPSSTTVAKRGLAYTTHEGNSWEATFEPSGTTILVDPWLVGDLTFGDTPWLYRGSKKRLPPVDLAAVCARTAAILVSQGLPDHAHGPTLAALPCKAVPVVCSPAAEAAVRAGGFTDVTVLKHGDSVTVADGRVAVTATPGALVGPPWSTRENGFVVSVDGVRVYYEPHADAPADALASIGTVDVVITPAVSQRLGGYPLVMGAENAAATAATLGASVVIPLVNADFDASGPLAAVIREEGDAAGLAGRLRAAGSRARVVEATAPGVAARVEL